MYRRERTLASLPDQPVAIVYPAGMKAAYAVIRNLGERGIPVLALHPTSHPHLKSRWAIPRISPHMARQPEEFFAFLEALSRQLPSGAVLYLMEDVYVYLAHAYRDRMPPSIRFPFLDDEALVMTLNKQPMLEAAERAGVPIPWSRFPTEITEIEALRGEIPFPCVVKPLVSRFTFSRSPEIELFSTAFGGKCVRAEDFDSLHRLVDKALRLEIPVCVQEQLMGPNKTIYTVHLYATSHQELLGVATGRKVRQLPADFGVGTLVEAARRPDAVPLARTLVEAVRFHGIAGVEFMEDPRTGRLKLIEINPRGIHWLGLGPLVGVELPYLQYADLTGEPEVQYQTDYALRWWDARRDWQYLARYGRPLRWAQALWGVTPSIFNLQDPMPGLMGLMPGFLGERYLAWKRRLGAKPDDPSPKLGTLP